MLSGRFHELPSWQKAFKRNWKRASKTSITMPQNDKYRPDSQKWVCTCLHFHKSRFLICKHLVQLVHPVLAVFFLEVKRNRTTPFWKHKHLVPLNDELDLGPSGDNPSSSMSEEGTLHMDEELEGNGEGYESDDGIVDTKNGMFDSRSVQERMSQHINMLRDFADGLQYQLQFNDCRMLDSLE
jgi:hypothetical protein